MIWLYSGTPGSGKSLHATKDILDRLAVNKKKPNSFVIANYNLTTKYSDKFFYMDNSDITPDFLIDFALSFHKIGKENQSLIVIDEAAMFFNCRESTAKDRKRWVQFFQQHRKLGYNIILICQFDRMLDRQVRGFIEYEIMHRKLNNAGGLGFLLNILHIPLFWTIERWCGAKMVTGKGFMMFSIRASKAYNTYDLFYDDRRQIEILPPDPLEVARKETAQAVSAFAKLLLLQRGSSCDGAETA